MSVTSFGSSQTLRWPQPSTAAASRFCSLKDISASSKIKEKDHLWQKKMLFKGRRIFICSRATAKFFFHFLMHHPPCCCTYAKELTCSPRLSPCWLSRERRSMVVSVAGGMLSPPATTVKPISVHVLFVCNSFCDSREEIKVLFHFHCTHNHLQPQFQQRLSSVQSSVSLLLLHRLLKLHPISKLLQRILQLPTRPTTQYFLFCYGRTHQSSTSLQTRKK